MLATVLGLVSASVLPSVSLILATLTPGGRSVQSVNQLHVELRSAMNALFYLLGTVGLVLGALFMLSIPPPAFLLRIPHLTTDVLPRLGQAIVVAASLAVIARASSIPAILRRCLKIRHEIAADEARRKTLENATAVGDPRNYFARNPAFGEKVKLSDLKRPTQD